MLDEAMIAAFLLVCLGFHAVINLHNILLVDRPKSGTRLRSKVETPSDVLVILGGLGTLVYFLETLAYPLFLLIDLFPLDSFFLMLQYPFMLPLQALGLIFTSAGFFIFNWSVVIRGRYAISWNMPENHRLITTDPYHYVRYPSYSGFFLMFVGLPLLLPNPFSLIPLVAIPGYYKITAHEERLLIERFGNEYLEYQKTTGRFFPKLHRTH
jgi:protein-S-isoprenylcysteine O-methyltransferase Ste14